MTISQAIARLRRDERGVAALEFALVGTFLVVGLLNAVDVGYYTYQRMAVENAAQVGAQAAWKNCSDPSTMLPATVNCTTANGAAADLSSAITAAIQSSSLGTSITLVSGYPAEGYYCINASSMLQAVGSLSSKPSNCSAAGNSALSPGDYIQVGVTYTYAPLFPGISVMGASGITAITATAWMRLG
ncbi:MAG TPA: TadE/TadG family type IV pilus assembly protein [Xanthobacteraceae bacterium]|nr:TadE/TadG family type IV pilus assembly protein [Xanthobacteraceae bacterium]